jgi:cellulose biosynthesis protein BcsQ
MLPNAGCCVEGGVLWLLGYRTQHSYDLGNTGFSRRNAVFSSADEAQTNLLARHCSDPKNREGTEMLPFGTSQKADIGLIDVGPNLGAINRCALVSADFVVVPIGADLFSIRGLQNVGPKLKAWRLEWQDRRNRAPKSLSFELPKGKMDPIGYVVSRYSSRGSRAAKAYQRWLDRAPQTYSEAVLGVKTALVKPDDDVNRLAQLKDYRSLMPMAQEVRKPMFLLKPADGAIGGHQSAVQECYEDFDALAAEIEERIALP